MSVVIDLVFAGLIAFVPNSSDDPASFTAYLLNEENHRPVLILYGDVCLTNQTGPCIDRPPAAGRCIVTRIGNRNKVECPLERVSEISFGGVQEERPKYFRRGPRQPRRGDRIDLDEVQYPDWLLRMQNVQGDAATSLSPAAMERTTGAKVGFGWESLQSCALDGSECSRVRFFRFDPMATFNQPLAERIKFTIRRQPGRFRIFLNGEGGLEDQYIKVDCAGDHCLGVRIENSLREQSRVRDHFLHYASVVQGRLTRKPSEVRYLPAPAGSGGLLECGLDLMVAIDRTLAEEIKALYLEAVSRGKSPTLKELKDALLARYTVASVVGESTHVNIVQLIEKVFGELIEIKQVQDRIVCPPVVLEP